MMDAANNEAQPPDSRPQASASAKPTCKAKTLKGLPCRNLPSIGSDYCNRHILSRTTDARWFENTWFQLLMLVLAVIGALGVWATIHYGKTGATAEKQERGLAMQTNAGEALSSLQKGQLSEKEMLRDFLTKGTPTSLPFVIIYDKQPTNAPLPELRNFGVLTNRTTDKGSLYVTIGHKGGSFRLPDPNYFNLSDLVGKVAFANSDVLQKNQISAHIINGVLFVSARIFDKESHQIVQMVDNEWKVGQPVIFDRNYTSNALEVMDNTGEVAFQIELNGNQLAFQARLFGSNGTGVTFIEPTPTHFCQTISSPRWPPIRTLFKYPSDLHAGEKNTESPEVMKWPEARLLVEGHEVINFINEKAYETVLVLPVGQTDISFTVTNSAPFTNRNIAIVLAESGKFAINKGLDLSKRVAPLDLDFTVNYIPPSESVPIPLTFHSDSSQPFGRITYWIKTETETNWGGLAVIFQPGIAAPYTVLIDGTGDQRFPGDFFIKPWKYTVPILVDKACGKVEREILNGDDTNRIAVMRCRGAAFFMLNDSPQHGCLWVTQVNSNGMGPAILNPLNATNVQYNVIVFNFTGSWDDNWKGSTFLVDYAREEQQMHLFQHMETTSNILILDGEIGVPIQ